MGTLTPLAPLLPSVGSVEVCPQSFAEQMGPACRAEVLHRDRLKKDVSFCGSAKQRGGKYVRMPITGILMFAHHVALLHPQQALGCLSWQALLHR